MSVTKHLIQGMLRLPLWPVINDIIYRENLGVCVLRCVYIYISEHSDIASWRRGRQVVNTFLFASTRCKLQDTGAPVTRGQHGSFTAQYIALIQKSIYSRRTNTHSTSYYIEFIYWERESNMGTPGLTVQCLTTTISPGPVIINNNAQPNGIKSWTHFDTAMYVHCMYT